MWLLFVGTGYNAIAHVDGVASYREFIYPGVIAMAALFGAMLTAIGTVYDREFGMLRLMLASPAGVTALLLGRAIAAAAVGIVQGAVVLLFIPMVMSVSPVQVAAVGAALVLGAAASSVLGLLVAAPLRSVENFAGVINVVLFPIMFLSGALYPTSRLPEALRSVARANPVTYAVDLMRLALGQPAEFAASRSIIALGVATISAFVLTAFLFDPEQRLVGRNRARKPPRTVSHRSR
jgi:ABC-2 type transport system permease protein